MMSRPTGSASCTTTSVSLSLAAAGPTARAASRTSPITIQNLRVFFIHFLLWLRGCRLPSQEPADLFWQRQRRHTDDSAPDGHSPPPASAGPALCTPPSPPDSGGES